MCLGIAGMVFYSFDALWVWSVYAAFPWDVVRFGMVPWKSRGTFMLRRSIHAAVLHTVLFSQYPFFEDLAPETTCRSKRTVEGLFSSSASVRAAV